MNSLIQLEQHDGEMRVSSRQLSEGIGTSYKATNNLIRKHKKRLETFGSLPFKKAAKSKTGQEIHAFLNEDQAIFLVTLSRNTEQVVEFKLQLVTAFAKLRRKQALIDANHAESKWHQNRELGILERRNLAAVIQNYINYAKENGSKGAGFYFIIITKAINKTLGISDRDEVSEDMLSTLSFTEIVVESIITQGINNKRPYKEIYQDLKERLGVIEGLLPEPVEEAA